MKLEKKESKLILTIENELTEGGEPFVYENTVPFGDIVNAVIAALKLRIQHCEDEILSIMKSDTAMFDGNVLYSNTLHKRASIPAYEAMKRLVRDLEICLPPNEGDTFENFCQHCSALELNQMLKAVAVHSHVYFKKELIDCIVDTLAQK